MTSDFTLAIHSLSLLAHFSGRLVSSDLLAESANVHPVRMRKVLGMLKKHRLIRSKEGAGGGFLLACDPRQVTLAQVYRMTCRGRLKPKCPDSNRRCMVGAHLKPVLGTIFSGAEDSLAEYLSRYSIADLLKQMEQEWGKASAW
jgi:Rrf2 family protein